MLNRRLYGTSRASGLEASMKLVAALAILIAALLAPATAWAQRHDRGFRDHDIHRFERHDIDTWRHGHWEHGWHNGRPGWWRGAGGVSDDYPHPVYPYPPPYVPPAIIVQPPPAPGPPPAQTWYY